MNVYLDVCCLNRPFDDQLQDRIRLESQAILLILARLDGNDWRWIGSDVAELEIGRTPDETRRSRVQFLLQGVHHKVPLAAAEIERGQFLETLGFHAFDALHLACAESNNADIFLTTDDRLLRQSLRLAKHLHVRVENPLHWLREVVENERS